MYCENNLNGKYWATVGPKLSELMGSKLIGSGVPDSGLPDCGLPRDHC
jgi:hypothetical protein